MLKIEMLRSPHSFSANCYLISSDGEYAVVDPTAPYSEELVNGRVRYILLTHAHFDHILEIESWVDGCGAEVIISEEGRDAPSDPMRNCFKLYNGSDRGYFGPVRGLADKESIPLGNENIEILHTPGHTSCSAIYLVDGNAFVGDTVFAGGGYGRYDLPTGNLVMLRQSIRRVMDLPEETLLYPGHGEATTVKEYKQDLIR